jgi:rhomboid-like protein
VLVSFSFSPLSSWTLVTSSFSHAEPGHALLNGLTFWFLAPTALAVLGNAQFLVLYLGSALNSPHLPNTG